MIREKHIGIIGPGRMGVGVATAVLAAGQGFEVTLFDAKERDSNKRIEALDQAKRQITANLKLLRDAGYGEVPADQPETSLHLCRELTEALSDCSIIFEAVPEKLELKRALFKRIDPLLSEDTIVASTTSTIDISAFWDSVSRPQNIINTHWLNPAFLIPLVEVAIGEKTSEKVTTRTRKLLMDLGKIPVVTRSSPGFIVPRIQAAAMNEAVRILEEGVAGPEDIDTAIKAGFGFRLAVLGLIEFIDLGGVDILYYADNFLQKTLSGNQFDPPRSVVAKMERGEIGPRAGKGFFDYSGVDVDGMFEKRYKGFLELLHFVKHSRFLRFKGGLEA